MPSFSVSLQAFLYHPCRRKTTLIKVYNIKLNKQNVCVRLTHTNTRLILLDFFSHSHFISSYKS